MYQNSNVIKAAAAAASRRRRMESIIRHFIIQSSLNLYSYSPIAAYNKKWREHRK